MNQKVKIVQAGWEGFTGNFGQVEFEDGVSVAELSQVEVDRLGGLLMVVDLDGEQVGVQRRLVDNQTTRADAAPALETAKAEDLANDQSAPSKPVVVSSKDYTVEELEEIAGKDGINGLRPIGTEFGVKGRSINELIKEILEAQAKRAGGAVAGEAN